MLKRSMLTAIMAILGLLVSGPGLARSADGDAPEAFGTLPVMADTRTLPDGLTASDWAGIRKAHRADRHRIVPLAGEAGVWQARNPGQAWRTRFDGRGFQVAPDAGGWTWGLELARYGIADESHEVGGASEVTSGATRLSYAWGAGLEEWFVNDTRGLEHGFTLRERPGSGPGPLILELRVRGELRPRAQPSGRALAFLDARGGAVLTYAGLTVFDADGRALSARLEVVAGAVKVVVADQGARYPVTIDPIAQQAYLKASNTDVNDRFGGSVAVSGDTVVVGAFFEDSCATGVDGDQTDNGCSGAGAAYVFQRTAGVWAQQAYLKASNTGGSDNFGGSVAVSGDTAVVGASTEASCATGIGGNQNNNGCFNAGAAYVFRRSGGVWAQQAYLKASNTDADDEFGFSVAVSGDTVVVGAQEDSCATGIGGNQTNNACGQAGAAYVFKRSAGIWAQQSYLKASNTGVGDQFGESVAVSGDTVVVGGPNEVSCATGVDGDQTDNSCFQAGAAYVFRRSAGVWAQEAYLKASNTDDGDFFGRVVALSGDTAVVGAPTEASCATGVDGNQTSNACGNAGATYVFKRTAGVWAQQAYLKASNTDGFDFFGRSVALSGDTAVVGPPGEASCATGVDGNQTDNACPSAGAAYVFRRSAGVWAQEAYLKASNTDDGDGFGFAVAVSGDTVVVGAFFESSCATGIDGNQTDNACPSTGAAYAFAVVSDKVSDFDGDEDSDIFWRHGGDGRNKLWFMDGLDREAVGKVPKFANSDWAVAGLGDFTGDGLTDVLWRNGVTGANKLWEMDGATRVSNKNLPAFADTDWVVAGVGDFFDNGLADIFWHNEATGANKIWQMNGATRVAQSSIPKFASTDWQPVGVGDFNDNGKVDILWRNAVTGANKIWPMNGFTRVANASIPALRNTDWGVAGLGDFNKNGKIDILWRNAVTGANKIWLMAGTTRKAQGNIPKLGNIDWVVVGTGDYDASKESDILWRNGVTGANKVWLMQGFTRADQSNIPKFGDTQWEVQH